MNGGGREEVGSERRSDSEEKVEGGGGLTSLPSCLMKFLFTVFKFLKNTVQYNIKILLIIYIFISEHS